MELTLFGYIFLPVCILSLFLPVRYLFAVTVFSCIFQVTFIALDGQRTLDAWPLACLFLIFRNFSTSSLWYDLRQDEFVRCVILFMIFTVCATLLFPHLEWNIPQSFNLDGGVRTISFQEAHIRGIGYVILFFCSLYFIYKNRVKYSNNFTENIFITSVITVCLIGLWEFTSKTTGTHTFPYTFFYNNPWVYGERGYMQGFNTGDLMRLNSTFDEPSYCGGFLAASFWAIMAMDKMKYKWLCILVGLTLILNLSGTGILSFFAGVPIFLCLKNKWKYILWMIIAGLIIGIIVYELDYAENIVNMVMDKKDSNSGFIRSVATWYSWEVFVKTWGIGVGLGGVRGGSFLLTMLASLGVIGTFLFGRIYYYLFKHSEAQNKWLTSFALVLLVAQTLALPDFTFPSMWMYFFMATALLPDYKLTKRNGSVYQDRQTCSGDIS
jgi:hypothetical protein